MRSSQCCHEYLLGSVAARMVDGPCITTLTVYNDGDVVSNSTESTHRLYLAKALLRCVHVQVRDRVTTRYRLMLRVIQRQSGSRGVVVVQSKPKQLEMTGYELKPKAHENLQKPKKRTHLRESYGKMGEKSTKHESRWFRRLVDESVDWGLGC